MIDMATATPQYQYYLKDHLGNTRVVVNSDNTAQQITNYYAFGLSSQSYQSSSSNKYLYNGKELQDDLIAGRTLDWLDYGARMYDPSLGRFHVQDRFAEKYFSMSPYQYAANNAVTFIDVNGDSLWISHRNEQILYENGSLYNKDGTAYDGKALKVSKDGTTKLKGFVGRAFRALNAVSAFDKNNGTDIISSLEGSKNNFTIMNASKRPDKPGQSAFVPDSREGGYALAILTTGQGTPAAGGSGGTIYWNPNGNSTMEAGGGFGSRPIPTLGHELFHGYQSDLGLLDNRPVNGLIYDEWGATHYENKIRGHLSLPLRSHYRTIANGPVSILNNGQPIQSPPPPSITWLMNMINW